MRASLRRGVEGNEKGKEKEKRKKEKGGEESITEFFFYAQNRVKFEREKRKKRIRPIYVSLPWWYYRFFTTYIHIYIYIYNHIINRYFRTKDVVVSPIMFIEFQSIRERFPSRKKQIA